MKSTSKAQSRFSQIPSANIQRSKFNRSHGHKTTFDAGLLIPIFVDEALPGDTFNLNATLFARLATPLKPVMDNMFLDTWFFAVPNRLLWDNWQKFNGEQTNPGDSTDFLVPQLDSGTFAFGSIHDHFGLPTGIQIGGTIGLQVNALHHRAYNLIYNEWFRDQNLQDSVAVHTDDGPDPISDYQLLRRGKRHDYFTSCLPWPQKGPAVELPIGGFAPVSFDVGAPEQFPVSGTGTPLFSASNLTGTSPIQAQGLTASMKWNQSPSGGGTVRQDASWADPQLETDLSAINLRADLSSATATTINALRESFQIQRMFERDARGGTRYTEIIHSHFGVVSPDSRLQRPEYLGGGSTPVNLTSVPQTTPDATTPQGNLAAYGIASSSGHSFNKSFTEHCVIVGLACVRADLTYQKGLNRMWSRQTRFDFYWPALAHLGEQEVLNKEIYAQGAVAHQTDNATFGYQERYAEYRYKPSQVTGLFRSDHPQSLDVWHLSQDFTTLPTLSAQFIQEDPPIDRVIAVPSEPHFIMDLYFNLTCARPMPTYSVPGLIDHF